MLMDMSDLMLWLIAIMSSFRPLQNAKRRPGNMVRGMMQQQSLIQLYGTQLSGIMTSQPFMPMTDGRHNGFINQKLQSHMLRTRVTHLWLPILSLLIMAG